MRILVVEDDVAMAASIKRALHAAGVVADIAVLADEALWMAQAAAYDVIVLDVMLPDMNGVDACRQLRGAGVWTPIIMVTARAAVKDRIRGLDAGADDYLTKPFSLGELLARLRALARREVAERPPVVSIGSLRLDPAARRVWRGDSEVSLTAREFALMEAFMQRPGQVLSHLQLLDAAWDFGYEHRSNVVEVYVRYLRGKVDWPFGLTSIETVRGVGYRLREDGGG
ncbi:MAG: response regulator transcription factor [Propionibacteriales bacterium]|nr:response regulator transcription factor [Propionibacteriales bacterium]